MPSINYIFTDATTSCGGNYKNGYSRNRGIKKYVQSWARGSGDVTLNAFLHLNGRVSMGCVDGTPAYGPTTNSPLKVACVRVGRKTQSSSVSRAMGGTRHRTNHPPHGVLWWVAAAAANDRIVPKQHSLSLSAKILYSAIRH